MLEQWLQLANDVTASVSQSHQSSREEKLVDYEKKSSNDDNAAVPPSPDSNEVIVGLKEKGGRIECWQEVKVLAIALIWLLEEQQQSSNTKLEILSPAHYSASMQSLLITCVFCNNLVSKSTKSLKLPFFNSFSILVYYSTPRLTCSLSKS